MFGDPWAQDTPHIPGSLEQPAFILPFEAASVWAHTGGPHNPWGSGDPLAALDFAPPLTGSGCIPSSEMATAIDDNIETAAFRLELVKNANGSESILWHGWSDGEKKTFDVDPYTSFWQRLGVGFMGLLPIESQL